jgi:hypothetical protein
VFSLALVTGLAENEALGGTTVASNTAARREHERSMVKTMWSHAMRQRAIYF